MARIKIEMPAGTYFTCEIPVRITDLNYGGHAGNDTILSLVHEARMQYLASLGYTEMELEGTGIIMADAAIEFRSELFYPGTILVSIRAAGVTRVGFDLYYRLERKREGSDSLLIALVKTAMVCFDYDRKKIVSLPANARGKLEA